MSAYQYIDLSYLEDLAMGSNDFKIEMLESFTRTTPESITKMLGCIENKDWKTLGGIAHKLKTSYSFMGMEDMVALSKELQDLGLEEQEVERIPAMVAQMKSAYEKAETELKEELAKLK